jgi:hypothetical protein
MYPQVNSAAGQVFRALASQIRVALKGFRPAIFLQMEASITRK